MFDDQDQELGPVLTLVIGLAIIVCLFTIGVALSVSGAFSSQPAGSTAVVRTADPDSAVAPIRILFLVGSSELTDDAANSLFTIVVAATVDARRRIELSGFHDASGDRAQNIELAKARARTVADALKAAGVAGDRIVLQKPAEVMGGSDPAEARRVDVTLR